MTRRRNCWQVMTMKIRELDYRVEYVPADSPELFVEGEQRLGICNYLKQIIFVSNDLTAVRRRRILAHEITHAFIEAYGHYARRNSFDAEDICEFISTYGREIHELTEEAMR